MISVKHHCYNCGEEKFWYRIWWFVGWDVCPVCEPKEMAKFWK